MKYMVNNISQFDACANCGACYNACPKQAILVDASGLHYAVKVDETKCVDCGLCVAVCPVNSPKDAQHIQKAYCGYAKNPEVVLSSSSGGAFHAIAQYVLSNGGVVWGADFDENYRNVVFRSTQETTLKKLQKSKYVESSVGSSFQEIKKTLENGQQVLFCGTPCQVAGLKRYLEKDYAELITCDFACGGLPGHGIYEKYIDYLENKYRSKVTLVDFRPKIYGWDRHAILVTLNNSKHYKKSALLDPYFYPFVHAKQSIRDYCYQCEFSNNHYADIILADFWKFRDFPNADINMNGTSLVITNSAKGEEVVRKVSESMKLEELDERGFYNLEAKKVKPDQLIEHQAYLADVNRHGLLKAYAMHNHLSWSTKAKHRIRLLTLKRKNGVRS